jgi:hypothetical protein
LTFVSFTGRMLLLKGCHWSWMSWWKNSGSKFYKRFLNCRIPNQICSDSGLKHIPLLYHLEVWWFSQGKMLKRLVELSNKLENIYCWKRILLLQNFLIPSRC